MQVTIDAVTTINGAPILSYEIQIDDGIGGTFVKLQDTLSLIGLKNTGIYAGRTYKLKYRARNAIGYGPFSNVLFVLAARKPDTPIPPVVSIVQKNARIRFSLPYNGGTSIFKA